MPRLCSTHALPCSHTSTQREGEGVREGGGREESSTDSLPKVLELCMPKPIYPKKDSFLAFLEPDVVFFVQHVVQYHAAVLQLPGYWPPVPSPSLPPIMGV